MKEKWGRKIAFENGESGSIDGVFVAYDSASSTDFARKLGIITDKNSIIVDNEQKKRFKIFAAGDCTGGFKQISTSVSRGFSHKNNIGSN